MDLEGGWVYNRRRRFEVGTTGGRRGRPSGGSQGAMDQTGYKDQLGVGREWLLGLVMRRSGAGVAYTTR